MKIQISDLKQFKRIDRNCTLDASDLLGAAPDFTSYHHPIQVRFTATQVYTDYLLDGEASTIVTLECARCLDPFDFPIAGSYKQDFSSDTEVIDVSPYARETIIMNLPIKPVCKPNCLGLCTQCGVNKNKVKCKCVEKIESLPQKEFKNLKFN